MEKILNKKICIFCDYGDKAKDGECIVKKFGGKCKIW
jgi:hypothetical protein